MEQLLSGNKDLVDLITQVLLIVLPILITWFIRTYVRGAKNERDMAAVVKLSNSAIDFVENLDKRGAIEFSPEASRGMQKLQMAGDWMERELGRAGIKMTNEEAQQWISSEFQNRVGEVKMTDKIAELANEAIGLARGLEQSGQLVVPAGYDRVGYLSELAADWLLASYAKKGAKISRDEALTWVRASFLQDALPPGVTVPVTRPRQGPDLSELADQAVEYVMNKKKSGGIKVRSGEAGGNVDVDIATARLIYAADERDLEVTSDQIASAIADAFRRLSS
jgi:hypothetical protein